MAALASSVLPNQSTTSAPKAITGTVCDTTKSGNTMSRSTGARRNSTPLPTPTSAPAAKPSTVSASVRPNPAR